MGSEATFRSAAPPHHRPHIPADGVVPATADDLVPDPGFEQAATDLIAQYARSQRELRSQSMCVPETLSMQHGANGDHGNAPASAAAPGVRADIADVRAAMHALSDAPTDMHDDVCADAIETEVHTPTDRSPTMPSASTSLHRP